MSDTEEAGPVADQTPLAPGQTPEGVQPPELTATPVTDGPVVKTGFLSTRNGRLVLVGGAVAILLVIAGIAAALLITVFGIFGGKTAAPVPPVSTAAAATSTAGTAPSQEPSSVNITIAPIGNADVYTVRDPFQPLIQNPLATATPTPSSNTTGSGSNPTTQTGGDENTLTLVSISTVDGVNKGTFLVGTTTYVAGAGEQLGSTPWQVISVGSTSAVVLFGDEQVTLAVGQGVTK